MIELTGDMFTSDAPALGHGVNCSGVMGAGVAKQFREKYPHNFTNYRVACQTKTLKPGMVHVNREDGVYILNMATQNMPGADATYPRVFEATFNAAQGAVAKGIYRVAIPEIASDIGGLDWWDVREILLTVEHIVNKGHVSTVGAPNEGFNWEVWHYDS